MPFLRGRKTEDDKIEFEIPPELQAKIDAGEAASKELEALKAANTEKDTALTNLRTEFEAFKATIPPPKVEPPKTEEEPDYFSDPKKAMETTIGKHMMPVVNVVAELRADRIMDDLRRQYPELSFSVVAQEFDSVVSKYSIGNRANKEFMTNAFRVVRDKLREEGKLNNQEFTNYMERSRQSSATSVNNGDSRPKITRTFSEEEKRFMNRVGLTEEAYLKTLEEDRFSTLRG